MPFPIVPVSVGLLCAGAALARFGRESNAPRMTPLRQRIYDSALQSLKDPDGLEALGNAFLKEGLNEQGEMLLKRAALRRLPPEERAKNRAEFKRGMSLKDPKEVLALADQFDVRGATGAAAELRRYARGLLATN